MEYFIAVGIASILGFILMFAYSIKSDLTTSLKDSVSYGWCGAVLFGFVVTVISLVLLTFQA